MTNGDMTRQMSDKELWVLKGRDCSYCRLDLECDGTEDECKKKGMWWLRQECEKKPREHVGILPAPCTKVNATTVQDWLQKINEELDEFKDEILNNFIIDSDLLRGYYFNIDDEYTKREEERIVDEAMDTITAITSMLEYMGIDENERSKAQMRVNERNAERGRL